MANQALRSSLRTVLASIRTQLATVTGLAESRIRLVSRDPRRVPQFDGDQDILLRIGGFRADPAHRDRHDCRIMRQLHIIARTRLDLDEADADDLWLTKDVGGSIVLEELIIDAMQNYFPESEDGAYVFQAIRVIQGEVPQKGGQQNDWGEVELLYQLGIRLPLDQSWQ